MGAFCFGAVHPFTRENRVREVRASYAIKKGRDSNGSALLWFPKFVLLSQQILTTTLHRLAASATGGASPVHPFTRENRVREVRASYEIKNKKDARWRLSCFGRGRETRTPGTRFWRPLLYQLSYTPICKARNSIAWVLAFVKGFLKISYSNKVLGA